MGSNISHVTPLFDTLQMNCKTPPHGANEAKLRIDWCNQLIHKNSPSYNVQYINDLR